MCDDTFLLSKKFLKKIKKGIDNDKKV